MSALQCMAFTAFYGPATAVMAVDALDMKCIHPGRHVFITRGFMAVTAIIGFVVINVVVAVQTVITIIHDMSFMCEQDFASFVLEHESNRFVRGWW